MWVCVHVCIYIYTHTIKNKLKNKKLITTHKLKFIQNNVHNIVGKFEAFNEKQNYIRKVQPIANIICFGTDLLFILTF